MSKIDAWDSRDSNTTFILDHCLFRSVKLANNSDSHKYGVGNKGSWNKTTSTVFGKYFKGVFSQWHEKKKKKQNKMERYTIFLLAMRLSMPVILKTFTSI